MNNNKLANEIAENLKGEIWILCNNYQIEFLDNKEDYDRSEQMNVITYKHSRLHIVIQECLDNSIKDNKELFDLLKKKGIIARFTKSYEKGQIGNLNELLLRKYTK
jgi:hypothetical protein